VLICLVGLPAATAVLVGVRDDLALGSVLLVYLLVVVVAAAVGSLLPGLLAALLSFGLANWFFTPPLHTLTVAGRDDLLELAVFAGAAVTVSAIVELAARDRAQHQRLLAEQAARTRELAAEDRVRSALLAAVGHDLRTPLAVVKAALSSLREGDVDWDEPTRSRLLARADESADRLTSLVTNLLDITRLRADAVTARLAPVALDEVVARALLVDHHGSVRVDVDDRLPLVLTDAALLERVVANLVENAVRFSPAHAPVEVRAETSRPRVGADGPGTTTAVLLHVVDHGPGIPAAEHDQLFTPFRQLGDRGTGSHVGLGLAIVRGFCEAIGAHVTPSTTRGGGLTMTVTLPVAP
jgi:two-component system, OmpR family, sensor histidine kinase KdpD